MGEPREAPIAFSAPLVREIFADRKTQTRRVAKVTELRHGIVGLRMPGTNTVVVLDPERGPVWHPCGGLQEAEPYPHVARLCPYGEAGSLLWVREPLRPAAGVVTYDADGATTLDADGRARPWPWKTRYIASRYCPRWASRLTLRVTEVRVERVQEISEEDAIAEGCSGFDPEPVDEGGTIYAMRGRSSAPSPLAHFRHLWDQINAARSGCSWEANPWVWCVTFEREEVRRG